MNTGINVECSRSKSRALKLLLTEGDPANLIGDMTEELTKGITFNKHDLAFWAIALESLAAGLKSDFSATEKELYNLLQSGIRTQITTVQVSKNGFKEGFDGNDT